MAAAEKGNGAMKVAVRVTDVVTYVAGVIIVWLAMSVVGMKEDLAVVKAAVTRLEKMGSVTESQVRSIVLQMITERVPPPQVTEALSELKSAQRQVDARLRALETK